MRIGVSFFYTFVNFIITICGSLFFLLITYQDQIQRPFRYFNEFYSGLITIFVGLPLALMFTLILKCKRKSICCGVALSNVQHFDINEWDVIEVEQEQDQAIEMTEILAS